MRVSTSRLFLWPSRCRSLAQSSHRHGRVASILQQERLSFDGLDDNNAFQLEQVRLFFIWLTSSHQHQHYIISRFYRQISAWIPALRSCNAVSPTFHGLKLVPALANRYQFRSRDLMCDAGLIPAVKAAQVNSNRGAISFMKCIQQGSIHRIFTKKTKKDAASVIHVVKSR